MNLMIKSKKTQRLFEKIVKHSIKLYFFMKVEFEIIIFISQLFKVVVNIIA